MKRGAKLFSAVFPGGACLEVYASGGVDVGDGCIRVSWDVALRDAEHAYLAERVAALFLVNPYRLEGDKPAYTKLVDAYRSRVASEEAVGLRSLLGPAYSEVGIDPLLLPVLRMAELGIYSCVFREALEAQAEDLRRDWSRFLGDAPLKRPRGYTVRPARLPREVEEYIAGLSSCESHELTRDTWSLVSAPEGRVSLMACGGLESEARMYDCKRPNPIASTLVCRSPSGEQVAVKNYRSAFYKWLLAAPLALRYGFRVSPTHRAVAEYIWFRRLRGHVETPRVLRLCLQPRRAVMVRTYLEGRPLSASDSEEDWDAGGRVLAVIHHSAGASLGDSNPGNILVGAGRGAVVDAEQAREYNDWRGAWDLAVAASYSMVLLLKKPRLIEAFVYGYADEAGQASVRVLELASNPKFLLSTPTPPHVALVLRRAARRALEAKNQI